MQPPDELEQPPFPDFDDERPPAQLHLLTGESNEPVRVPFLSKSLASACSLLRNSDLRARLLGPGPLELNQMSGMVELNRVPLRDSDSVKFRENAELMVRGSDATGKQRVIQFGPEAVSDALIRVASEHAYHPVQEYLGRVILERPAAFGIDVVAGMLGLPTGLPRTLLRKWAIGCVARAMQPGCQHKSVLILVSKQDDGKSAFFRTMAGEQWFADSDMDLRRNDAYLQLHSAWIYEWPELSTMHSGTIERTKAFVSSTTDTYRAPYARTIERHPRSTVIVGTSNGDDFLNDPTGNVRFWTVKIDRVLNLRGLNAVRDEFWSEAVALWQQGEQWWLTQKGDQEALAALQKDFSADSRDPWVEDVIKALRLNDGPEATPVTVRWLLKAAVDLRVKDMDRSAEKRMAAILRGLGWAQTSRPRDEHGVQIRAWEQKNGTMAQNGTENV